MGNSLLHFRGDNNAMLLYSWTKWYFVFNLRPLLTFCSSSRHISLQSRRAGAWSERRCITGPRKNFEKIFRESVVPIDTILYERETINLCKLTRSRPRFSIWYCCWWCVLQSYFFNMNDCKLLCLIYININ